jgi:hypothetical protein
MSMKFGNPEINMNFKSQRLLLVSLFFVASLSVMTGFVVREHKASAVGQNVLTVTLKSSELVLEDPFASALGSLSLTDDQIYMLRRDAGDITVYDPDRRHSKHVVSFAPTAKALAVGTQGRMYLASESEVRVIDQAGRLLSAFPINNPTSLTVTASGDVAVGSPDSEKLLHVYDQTGLLLRSIGTKKRFDSSNLVQNSFLNRGKVLASPSDVLYYVSIFAPTPTVQKFSSQGELLGEFAIEGNTVGLQLEHAKDFLRTKNAETVGGFHVITSAAIDPITGHLWIGMNGSSTHGAASSGSGVVYEYDSNGVKLAEYAFFLDSPLPATGIITDVRDIAVKTPWIYVLTSQGQLYRFNMNDRFARKNKEPKTESTGGLTSLARRFWSGRSAPPTVVALCPPEQPFTCVANCPSGSTPTTQDCAAEIKRRLTTGDVIISNSCTINPATPGGCNGNATSCNNTSGVQVSYSVTLACNAAPTPTPAPAGGSSSCATSSFTTSGSCPPGSAPMGYGDLCCLYSSPLLLDIDGNGFAMTDYYQGVPFDIGGSGSPRQVSWTAAGSDDAWLVLDRNHNNLIDDGTEMFGDATEQPMTTNPRNGFAALAVFNTPERGGNGDGVIDSRDAIFSSLRLWQDTNHNGISEPSELHTLPELGVDSISLDYKESRRTDQYGNRFRFRAKIRDRQDARVGRWAWDVFLLLGPPR